MLKSSKNYNGPLTGDDDSISPNIDENTKEFLALSGTWEDDRPVEEIIRDIYESRTSSCKRFNFLEEKEIR